ncbi:MAG: hypothetical protein GXO68_02675 [Crenarchaeota archaeon]|nr:hypothetical protein [Thermoproteota archaeon]
MIPWLLQRIEAAINYEEERGFIYQAHAGLKIVALALSWMALIYPNTPIGIGIALTYPLLLHILAGWRRSKYAVVAASIPVLFIGIAALLISPYRPLTSEWINRGLVLMGRVYGLATGTLLTFSTTTPLRLASLLARRVPLLHDIVILLYRLAPQTTSDLATAYVGQRLIGKGLRDPLVGAVLAQLKRGKFIELSLYTRGMPPSTPRTPIAEGGSFQYGMILVLASGLVLAITLIVA